MLLILFLPFLQFSSAGMTHNVHMMVGLSVSYESINVFQILTPSCDDDDDDDDNDDKEDDPHHVSV